MSTNKKLDVVSKALEAGIDQLFKPTDAHKKAKSAFWYAVAQGSVPQDNLEPDLSIALKFANDSRIRQYWDLPGFIDWFYNREDFRRNAEYLGALALDQLEPMLSSVTVDSKTRLAAIKLALEVSGKLQKAESEPVDEQISKLTKEQLREFINKRAGLLTTDTQPSLDTKKN